MVDDGYWMLFIIRRESSGMFTLACLDCMLNLCRHDLEFMVKDGQRWFMIVIQ